MTDTTPPEPRPSDDDTLPLFPEPSATSRRRDGPSPEEVAQILKLRAQGLGTRPIAKALGRSRTTIRRVLEREGAASPAPRPASSGRPSKLDPFREAIAEKVAQGLTVTRILRELREEGYSGGRTILSAYAASLRTPLAPKARRVTRRFETEPGQEIQVDWSTYRVLLGGRERTVQALAMVLGCSRYAFLRFYESQRQALLLEGLEAGLRAFGGVTRKLVFDNMATVVLGRVGRERKPLWNPELLAFARHYGFEPWLCRVADPNRKGEVEAFLGYAERDFVRGRSDESLPALNRAAERWLAEVANQRRHGTTGRIPAEAWAEERPFLIALPEAGYPGACSEEYRKVAEDCTVSIGGTRYTVPARLAHRQVRVRLYAERFEVLERDGSIAFARAYAVGEEARRLQLDPDHYADLPRKREARGGKTKRLKEQVVTRWPALEGFVDALHARVKGLLHVHLRALLRLAERYGDEALEAAALRAAAAQRATAQAVERILAREATPLQAEALPLAGDAARAEALLGEVEEATLEGFGYLDAAEPTRE